MHKITPCLWFDDEAEQAAAFYTSVFRDSRLGAVSHYGEAGAAASGKPKGSVMMVVFELEGQTFMALNGGPHFTFSPAISLVVHRTTQREVDELWERLSEGGEAQPCGWVKDKYGVSWQIVPAALGELMQGSDPEGSERVMAALLQMKKIDIEGLRRAHATG